MYLSFFKLCSLNYSSTTALRHCGSSSLINLESPAGARNFCRSKWAGYSAIAPNFLVREKKKLNGNIFVELFSRDLDEKMTSASYKRERNKNKAAPCEADNLFNLFTTCPSSRTG